MILDSCSIVWLTGIRERVLRTALNYSVIEIERYFYFPFFPHSILLKERINELGIRIIQNQTHDQTGQ